MVESIASMIEVPHPGGPPMRPMISISDWSGIDVMYVDLDDNPESVCSVVTVTLFRNKRFVLNKMFQGNASKFAIFYV